MDTLWRNCGFDVYIMLIKCGYFLSPAARSPEKSVKGDQRGIIAAKTPGESPFMFQKTYIHTQQSRNTYIIKSLVRKGETDGRQNQKNH